MTGIRIRGSALLLCVAVFATGIGAQQGFSSASATVQINVSTSGSTGIEAAFAGFNVALMDKALSYTDPRLMTLAKRLAPAWLRYPAGTRSEAFDWTTGESRSDWVDRFAGTRFHAALQDTLQALAAKGGERVDDAYALAKAAGARDLIICVNVFTDTPASAGRFAAYAKQHAIRVFAWQLGNEPTLSPEFFPTAGDYAEKVRPFADAIKAADPDARISLFLGIDGRRETAWDDALAAVQPRYWDVLTYHEYPQVMGADHELMTALNRTLLLETTQHVKDLASRFGKMPIIVTEAGPGLDRPGRGLWGTLYGGIWSAELVLRLSSMTQVKRVGIHQLIGPGGIDMRQTHHEDLLEAFQNQRQVDGRLLDYDLFVSAQASAYAVAMRAINAASRLYPTAVTGGGTAPLPGEHESMPAIFAQAYSRGRGFSLVVTNKGSASEVLSVGLNGQVVNSPFRVETVTGPGPFARNSFDRILVQAVASRASRTIPIPAYSIVLISWGE